MKKTEFIKLEDVTQEDEKLNSKEKSGTEPQKEQEHKNEEEIYDSEHPSEERKRKLIILCCVSSIILFLIIIGIIALASYEAIRYFTFTPNPPINRINFGSCVSYNNLRQPIWSEGVLPRNPEFWVWNGDFAYMDNPLIDCSIPSNLIFPDCNCSNTNWLKIPPFGCLAGDIDNAVQKAAAQLKNPDYQNFLQYMCPNYLMNEAPPNGEDSSICTKPIIGIYDDHDFTWNDGNRRLPQKNLLKQIFLDAMGVSGNSPRRNSMRGIEFEYIINAGQTDEIRLYLLDERYNRDPLPCYTKRAYCLDILQNYPNNPKYGWCNDFLNGYVSGSTKFGSCCDKDETIYYGWCLNPNNQNSQYYPYACDATSPLFGTISLQLDGSGNLVPTSSGIFESPFCEVLGANQRAWLLSNLRNSSASLNIIFSPSVVVSQPNYTCHGDEFDCYRPAQINLLNILINSGAACTILVVGDYHQADIRIIRPGNQPYSSVLGTSKAAYPIYQILSSGMTSEIMTPCGVIPDPWGFRINNTCIDVPNFGEIDVNWDLSIVNLRIISQTSQILLQTSFNMNQCAKH